MSGRCSSIALENYKGAVNPMDAVAGLRSVVGHDWTPDHNWGGSGMIGLQEMLFQQRGNTLYLLPAWPSEWDVSFKMHLQGGGTVEASIKDGKAAYLKITGQDPVVVWGNEAK